MNKDTIAFCLLLFCFSFFFSIFKSSDASCYGAFHEYR